ncbi:MAG: hypothetical protein O7D91_20675 [Planctomycetota bacterium]|nr:hypothetical protein [Planctomycetota bacterium]
MNGMCKCFHSWSASACPVARVILTALLALLPAAGCEKKAADTPPQPQATKTESEATPAPSTVLPNAQPETTADQASRVADKKVLPPPQQIFDRHIEVTGGLEAYEKLRNVLTLGTITVTRSGQDMGFTEYRAAPDKYVQIIESDDRGVLREGCDGETVWRLSEQKGPLIFEGAARASLMREGAFNKLLHLADLYQIVETVGIEEIDGVECYHVLMTPPRGLSESNFYSVDSGLLMTRRVLIFVPGPSGHLPREVALGEYEETGGIRAPRKLRKTQMGHEFITTIDSVEYNVDLADDFFDLPDDVRAALEEALAGSSEGPSTQPVTPADAPSAEPPSADQEKDPPGNPATQEADPPSPDAAEQP